MAAFWPSLVLAVLLVCLTCSNAYGDVGVVLNETLGTSLERVTGSGHAAVYFSRICPESPVKLRLCRPGEEGSVMSTYVNLGENQRYMWNVVPLSVYVYGVDNPQNQPLFGSEKLKALLEDRYRDTVLPAYCSDPKCMTSDKAEWREMVGAGLSRGMYIFIVHTTLRQDLDMIAKFDALPNEDRFNGVTRNCADFTKDIIDTYFPHSAHRDLINDFGMTSPKAVARSFTHYARSHPESQFRVLHFSQVPGTIKRSSQVHSGTEELYHSKKFLIPMIILAYHELPFVAATYELTGRFNPESEFEAHPTVVGNYVEAVQSDHVDGDHPPQILQIRGRQEAVGTRKEWKAYRKEFDFIVAQAVREETVPNHEYLGHFFQRLQEKGTPYADENGALWLAVSLGNETVNLGVSANDLFARDSDSNLAFALLLARIDRFLKSPKHSRETLPEFKRDWALLQEARIRISVTRAAAQSSAARTATILAAGDD